MLPQPNLRHIADINNQVKGAFFYEKCIYKIILLFIFLIPGQKQLILSC